MSGIGEAGPRGADVRSDCWVQVEFRSSGGVEIDLKSKVDVMYGDRIRSRLLEGAQALGLDNALIRIEDMGALEFVIDARLESAVRRANPDLQVEFLPPMRDCCRYETSRDRLRRSRLYLPGNQPKLFVNAGLHRPDGLILDLEDAVAASEKDTARAMVRNALRSVDFLGAERMVRINQGEMGVSDLDWVIPHNTHLVLIPKVEDPEQVKVIDRRIQEIRKAQDIKAEVLLMPIIESALGAWKAYEIAASSENIVGLAIGLEDYTADIGTQRTLAGHESFWARAQVINGAVAAGVQPIDTVFSDVADSEGLRTSCDEAKSLGFVGKGCIHPRQIAVVHEAFAPGDAELEKAMRIVLAFEDAEARGLGVVSLGSKMIDAPVVKRAHTTLRLATATGQIKDDWRETREEGSAS
jgi:citrate lyase subunit beta / citryl-CoA lyase